MSRFRPRLTYANVVASIALFGVVAGGSAWAHGKIGSNQIKKNAVAAKHIKKSAVKAPEIANGAVRPQKTRGNSGTALNLQNGWGSSNPNRPARASRGGFGTTQLSGRVSGAASAFNPITTLPRALRPRQNIQVPTVCRVGTTFTVAATLLIDADGTVRVTPVQPHTDLAHFCGASGSTSLEVSFRR